MNQSDHLALQLSRLKFPQQTGEQGEGLYFAFVKGGLGKYVSAAGSHRLSPGDLLVFNRSPGGTISAQDESELLYWNFSATVEHLLPLFSCYEVSQLGKLMDLFKSSKVYSAREKLADECHRLLTQVPPQNNLDHRGQLIRIAASVLSAEINSKPADDPARAEDQMVRVFEKLSASELINLSVEELASRFNCSRRHLNRLFHQKFGVSVASLRMEMRLIKAISLLRDPEAKVINVAEECGFNHLGLFNTCFKRRFGTSPGQWRKLRREVGMAPPRKAAVSVKNKAARTPECPLEQSGQCPLRQHPAGRHSVMVSAFAGKIPDGEQVMADLDGRNLLFNDQYVALTARAPSKPETEKES